MKKIKNWNSWSENMLLLWGCALILSGIIFFFAYNWDSIGRFQKLGVIEIGIIGCAVAAYFRGLTKIDGKILLLCSAVLVGVLLAVYGQIYQTGADFYELFLYWAILIFGWVLIAKFKALWFIWLVIVNTSIVYYYYQIGYWSHQIPSEQFYLSLAAVNGIALIIYSAIAYKRDENSDWFSIIELILTLLFLTIPTINYIFCVRNTIGYAVIFWCLIIITGYIFYKYKAKKFVPIVIIAADVCIVLLSYILKKLDLNIFKSDSFGVILLFAFIILIVTGVTIFLLKKVAAEFKPKNEISVKQTNKNKEPIVLQIFSGAAAWFAALLILLFFGMLISGTDESGTFIFFGSAYFIGAIIISKTTKINFFNQFALAFAFAGNVMLVMGFSDGMVISSFKLPLVELIICVITYPFFSNKIYRFAAPLFTVVLTTVWITEVGAFHLVNWLIIVEAVIVCGLLYKEKLFKPLIPLLYSSAVMLPYTILFFTINKTKIMIPLNLSLYYLSAILLFIFIIYLRDKKRGFESWLYLAIIATILLGIFTSPGIIAAIILLIIGYEKQDKFLLIFANLFLICFVYLFYYNLGINLAFKSWILAGSGLLLLSVRLIAKQLKPEEV